MYDFIYIDAETDAIIMVCVGVKDICEADYHFHDVVGEWPWKFNHVYAKREITGLQCMYSSDWYIPE